VEYEDRLTVSTPEGVELELVLAGVASRLIAALIDWLLKGAVILALFVAFGSHLGGVGIAVVIVIVFLILFAYDVLFEVLASGRTPGKRWTGLRVVRAGGGRIDLLSSAVRNLVRLVDFLPTSYAVGIATILLTRHNQRLGDLAAGTLVVRERREAPRASPAAPDLAARERLASWDVSAISQEELHAVRHFLARRSSLAAPARADLAAQLADGLRPKVAGAALVEVPERFLEDLALAKASRG